MKIKYFLVFFFMGLFFTNVNALTQISIEEVFNQTVNPTTCTYTGGSIVTSFVNESDNVISQIIDNDRIQCNNWEFSFPNTTSDWTNLTNVLLFSEVDLTSGTSDIRFRYNTGSGWDTFFQVPVSNFTNYTEQFYSGVAFPVDTTGEFNLIQTRTQQALGTGDTMNVDYIKLLASYNKTVFNSSISNISFHEQPALIHFQGRYVDPDTDSIIINNNVNITSFSLTTNITYFPTYNVTTDHYDVVLDWLSGNVSAYINATSFNFLPANVELNLFVPEINTTTDGILFTQDGNNMTISTYWFFDETRDVFFGNVPNETMANNQIENITGVQSTVTLKINNINYSMSYDNSLGDTLTNYFGNWSYKLSNLNFTTYNYTIYFEGKGVINQILSGNFTMERQTQLDVIFEKYPFVLYAQNNLITANYTTINDSLIILNSTCVVEIIDPNNISESNNMSFNSLTNLSEIIFIPDQFGQYNFSVSCSKLNFQPQLSEQDFTTTLFATSPSLVKFYLWENRNMTTPYLDEFSYILLEQTDGQVECKGLNNKYDNCWYRSKYQNGEANVTLYIDDANYSIYYYSGRLTFQNEFSSPKVNTFNDIILLGTFSISLNDPNETRIDLLVNPYELNFWTKVKGFMGTWLITLIGGILIIFISLFLFKISGSAGFVGALLIALFTLWFKLRGVF